MVGNLPANIRNSGLIPGPESKISHRGATKPWSSQARAPQLQPAHPRAHAPQQEKRRNEKSVCHNRGVAPLTTTRESQYTTTKTRAAKNKHNFKNINKRFQKVQSYFT